MEGTTRDDFRFFELSLSSRLLAAGAVYLAGLALAIALGSARWLGLAVAALGWAPLMLKAATNCPEDQGFEEWRPVPMEEIDRLDDGIREARKLRSEVSRFSAEPEAEAKVALGSARSRKSLSTLLGIGVFLVVSAVMFTSALDVAPTFDAGALFLGFAALLVLFVPALFFGRVKVFSPPEIAMKMPCFRAMLGEKLPAEISIAPYVRFDKDKNGADVPEDLRFLYELKRPPADLVGVQVQAAINRGPDGDVPYMYAVVLTEGNSGPSYKAAVGYRRSGYEVEAGGDDRYGSVVVRQETSGGGYATTPDDCRALLGICVDILKLVAPRS